MKQTYPLTPLVAPLEAFPCAIHRAMLISICLHAILLRSIPLVYVSMPLVYVVLPSLNMLSILNL